MPYRTTLICLLLAALAAAPLTAAAQSLNFRFESNTGEPVSDVIVTAGPPLPPVSDALAIMDQQDKEFRPYVLPVRLGTRVSFPNSDQIRHHVYSFSPAKRFELRLYSGQPGEPVVFDEAGIAALGCNIHDNMIGYIYITAAEAYGVSNENGEVTIKTESDVNDITVWHPALSFDASQKLELSLSSLAMRRGVYVINLGIDTPPANPQGVDTDTDRFQQFLPGQ